MSLCEKVNTYKEIVQAELGDASILNVEFFKDTNQVNIVFLSNENGKKIQKKWPVVMNDDMVGLKDQLWSLIYPQFEAKQIIKAYRKDYAESLTDLQSAAEAEYDNQVTAIDLEVEAAISDITAEYGIKINAVGLSGITDLEEYKIAQEKIKALTQERDSAIAAINEKLSEGREALKNSIEEEIIGAAKAELEEKILQVNTAYGLA